MDGTLIFPTLLLKPLPHKEGLLMLQYNKSLAVNNSGVPSINPIA